MGFILCWREIYHLSTAFMSTKHQTFSDLVVWKLCIFVLGTDWLSLLLQKTDERIFVQEEGIWRWICVSFLKDSSLVLFFYRSDFLQHSALCKAWKNDVVSVVDSLIRRLFWELSRRQMTWLDNTRSSPRIWCPTCIRSWWTFTMTRRMRRRRLVLKSYITSNLCPKCRLVSTWDAQRRGGATHETLAWATSPLEATLTVGYST